MYLNEQPIEFSFENGDKCVKCPLDEILHLLDSFNLKERPKPLSIAIMEKRKMKEAKMIKLEKANNDKLIEKVKLDLEKRLKKIFDEEEIYVDKEIPPTTSI